jgi:hypothetical protein
MMMRQQPGIPSGMDAQAMFLHQQQQQFAMQAMMSQ